MTKKLLFALWITPFFLGIVILFTLPRPATVGGLLFGIFIVGEFLFVGGIILAAAAIARLTWRERVTRSFTGGIEWLRELTRRAAESNVVLAGLILNWAGAVLYPVVLTPFASQAFSGQLRAGALAILLLDIVASFAVRVPLLVYILRQRRGTSHSCPTH